MFSTLFNLQSGVSRRTFATVGLCLAALKYAVDALVLHFSAGLLWTPLNYLQSFGGVRIPFTGQPVPWVYPALAIWTLPFLWIGASLTLRRALDAGWSPWAGLLFFVPVVNYVVFLWLSLAPSRPLPSKSPGTAPLVDDRFRAAFLGVACAVTFALAMLGVQVYAFHTYGGALFFGTPVVMGALCAYIQNLGHARTWSATRQAAIFATLLCAGSLLLFALEGVICIGMALPIALAATIFGAWIGRAIAINDTVPASQLVVVLAAVPLLAGMEALPHAPVEYEVVSSVIIDAPPEKVWPNVVGFSEIPAPTEWLFKTGISYPVRARIDGAGVGAIRRCEFTTGPFVEPITTWDPPTRLSFGVTSQPEPMQEWTPYSRIHPPHLDGYFRSTRGEFRLVALPDHRTRLEGSTWYVLEIAPSGYWRLGAEAILHAIHQRVLRHVKALSEG